MQSSCQPGLPAPPCKGGKGPSMGWWHLAIPLLSITTWTSGSGNPPGCSVLLTLAIRHNLSLHLISTICCWG